MREAKRLRFTSEPKDLKACRVYIVTVPTPIDADKRPDLTPLERASETVGKVLKRGDIVIYESTVFPGCTEEICVPILERHSRLKFNRDFHAGYSPERINPGDREHRLPTIRKVTSGSTPEAAAFVDKLYASIITAGTHQASSIRVAEAAKVIENTQRDVNIALVNELSMIFNRLGIDTQEVLEAAGSKWNFLPFRPGLVGGHCIGVDPYYLTHKAQQIGYHPEMILAGRRINDNMALYVAGEVVRLMAAKRIHVKSSRVLVMGLAFKENSPDLRNSKVADLVAELKANGAKVDVWDPWVNAKEARARVRHQSRQAALARPLRCDRAGRRPPRVPGDEAGRNPPPREAQARHLRHQVRVRARAGRRPALMRVLVTGAAGFIGYHVAERLLARGDEVVGLDNLNPYYDPALKQARLERLQVAEEVPVRAHRSRRPRGDGCAVRGRRDPARRAPRRPGRRALLGRESARLRRQQPDRHAARAGRLPPPSACEHLVFASTSSVYGANTKMPFSVHQNVDHPLSFYAATKKANELMAHTYASLYGLPVTGLRFFTVYGPWGRPDMALFLFTRNILAGKPIDVFNYGKHRRDFTYVDDIAGGVVAALDHVAAPESGLGRRQPGSRDEPARRTGSTTSATTGRSS